MASLRQWLCLGKCSIAFWLRLGEFVGHMFWPIVRRSQAWWRLAITALVSDESPNMGSRRFIFYQPPARSSDDLMRVIYQLAHLIYLCRDQFSWHFSKHSMVADVRNAILVGGRSACTGG